MSADLAVGHAAELRRLYVESEFSTSKIADHFGVSKSTARKALLLADVPLRRADNPVCRKQIARANTTTGAGRLSYPGRGKNLRFGYRWAGPALRERRLESGLTQRELARRLRASGCGQVTNQKICDFENGRRRSPPELQEVIAVILAADVDELFEPDLRERRPAKAAELYEHFKSTVRVATELEIGVATAGRDVVRAGSRLLPQGIATLYPEEREGLAERVDELR
jgi:transcriptional regulator with XRE-family HTH domain